MRQVHCVELIPSKRTHGRVHTDRRALAGGETFAKGIDFVGVLLVFFGLGWLLDRTFGTTPWIMITLGVVGLVGQFVRMYYAYDAEMREHEAELRAQIHRGEGA
jgi:F0F1-type ATP synthase assembly protein I